MAWEVLTSLHGRRFGLTDGGALITRDARDRRTVLGAVHTVAITSAQVLALSATPQTIVPAPGAGFVAVPTMIAIRKPAGTAYAGIAAGEDLVAKYTNGSGAQCSGMVETTGFLDQTTEELRVVGFLGATGTTTAAQVEPVANAAIVLHLLAGEITTGDSSLHVRTWYNVIETGFIG